MRAVYFKTKYRCYLKHESANVVARAIVTHYIIRIALQSSGLICEYNKLCNIRFTTGNGRAEHTLETQSLLV